MQMVFYPMKYFSTRWQHLACYQLWWKPYLWRGWLRCRCSNTILPDTNLLETNLHHLVKYYDEATTCLSGSLIIISFHFKSFTSRPDFNSYIPIADTCMTELDKDDEPELRGITLLIIGCIQRMTGVYDLALNHVSDSRKFGMHLMIIENVKKTTYVMMAMNLPRLPRMARWMMHVPSLFRQPNDT